MPPGCRILQLSAGAAAAALEELDEAMDDTQGSPQEKLEMQWGYFALSRSGQLRRKRPIAQFPKCAALIREANQGFALQHRDEECLQVSVRRYWEGMQCQGHIDSTAFFDEPNLFVFLKTGGPPDGLRLYTKGAEFLVREAPGVAVCLEGPARYDTYHSVPRVLSPRVSLTWRWFREGVLEELAAGAGQRREACLHC